MKSKLRQSRRNPDDNLDEMIKENHSDTQIKVESKPLDLTPDHSCVEVDTYPEDHSQSTMPSPTNSGEVTTLRETNEYLEEIIDQLEREKNALKLRLNATQYYDRFRVGDCKKWLQSNFDFDRKDTPQLLAAIFENYLIRNDDVGTLPHQLLVKNSLRARSRRKRRMLKRLKVLPEKTDDLEGIVLFDPLEEDSQSSNLDGNASNGGDSRSSSKSRHANPARYQGSYRFVVVDPSHIEDLYATEPWAFYIDTWPKVTETGTSDQAASQFQLQYINRKQHEFLKEHACALWERRHWFPLRPKCGDNKQLNTLCSYHHRKRKRRQSMLKEHLERIVQQLKKKCSLVMSNSIFSDQSVKRIMTRPRAWIPSTEISLSEQLEALDRSDPERNYNLRHS